MPYVILSFILLVVHLLISRFKRAQIMKRPFVKNDLKFQHKYQPIDYETINRIYGRVKRQILELGENDERFFDDLELMMHYLIKIFDHADKTCCGQVQANGYYSMAKLIFRIIECIESDLSKGDLIKRRKTIKNYGLIGKAFLIMVRKIHNLTDYTSQARERHLLDYPQSHRQLKIHQNIRITKQTNDDDLMNNNSIDNESIKSIKNTSNGTQERTNSFSRTVNGQEFDSLPLFTVDLEVICDLVYEGVHQSSIKEIEIIFREYPVCWLDPQITRFFHLYQFFLPFLRAHLYQYPRLLLDKTYRTRFFSKISRLPTINFPFNIWDFGDSPIALIIMRFLTREAKIKSKEVHIPTQNTIQINRSPDDRLTIHSVDRITFNGERKIRAKYITAQNVDLTNSDRLVVQLHGGGFMSQRCDSYEVVLRRWVNLNKIPILAVDYRTKREFPVAHQDAFDVYVWLRKAPVEEVKSLLGFYPKRIVVVGDSAGGNCALGIALILHDLRTDYKFNVEIKMPDGVMPLYSPFLTSAEASPSRVLAIFDSAVTLGVQLVILHAITGCQPELRLNTTLEDLKLFLFPQLDVKPWTDSPQDVFYEKVKQFATHEISPYLSSLHYDKYDTLTDLPLHLISAEYDTFLDESITLAKIYRGPLKVDVLSDICHAWINTSLATKNVSDAAIYCAKEIEKMFE